MSNQVKTSVIENLSAARKNARGVHDELVNIRTELSGLCDYDTRAIPDDLFAALTDAENALNILRSRLLAADHIAESIETEKNFTVRIYNDSELLYVASFTAYPAAAAGYARQVIAEGFNDYYFREITRATLTNDDDNVVTRVSLSEIFYIEIRRNRELVDGKFVEGETIAAALNSAKYERENWQRIAAAGITYKTTVYVYSVDSVVIHRDERGLWRKGNHRVSCDCGNCTH